MAIYLFLGERKGGPDDDMHIYDLVYSKRDNTIDILFIFFLARASTRGVPRIVW